ncbi:MAG: pentapeptide repeat-containing protein [Polyangiaceae bacterium]
MVAEGLCGVTRRGAAWLGCSAGAALSGAALSGAALSGAALSGAALSGAALSGAASGAVSGAASAAFSVGRGGITDVTTRQEQQRGEDSACHARLNALEAFQRRRSIPEVTVGDPRP